MREQRTVLSLLLIFCFAAFPILEIGIVKAEMITSVYIKADGSVEGTERIQRDENVYTLTDNIDNSPIYVLKDDVVIDGAGYTLRGPPSGIALLDRDNVTIKNFVISIEEYVGDCIYVYYCSNCTIMNNKIEMNRGTGISVWGGASNVIAGNQIVNNTCGIYLGENTKNNRVFGNNLTDNTCSIRIYGAQNNSIYYNNFINNDHISIMAISPGTTLTINFDNGTTGNYWNNYKGTDPDGDGIGNTPYFIDENYQDNYPLTEQVQVIPEFPSWMQLLIMLLVVVCVAVIYKRRLTTR